MKSFLSLLLALLIIGIIGGTAYCYWDISEGARFEREIPKPSQSGSSPAPTQSAPLS